MKLLEGKTAIVTGASRGIGKAIAIKFAEEGCNIAFTDLFYDDIAMATEAELQSMGVKAKAYASDASKFDETQNIVAQIIADFGSVDILINNAGITKDTLLMRMTENQWDAVIIVNMSSVVGVSGNAGQANYSASKAGIIGFTKSIAKELGSRGIRSNAIAPGFIITEMTAKIPEEARKQWEATIPMKRGGLPEEVAKVALFLASDLASYVSGQVINVCGAMNT